MGYARLDYATPDALEREVLAQWRAERLFRRTLEATREGQPFVFFEGPPTANGRPGIHHVFARTIKDLVCRYHTMLGESVTRIAGWDTHGLPVEIEVEKALGISGKPDIEKLGVAEFNRRCRESVFQYKGDWESLSDRIGYWLDYEHPYVTYSNEYIESVWWLLQRLHEKGRLFQAPKVLPYCIRCGTSLSSHELALGYETHKSPSIYVLLRVDRTSRPDEEVALDRLRGVQRFLLVWTTTPWTLPSNVAVAVNPEFSYVELDVDGKRLIVERTIAEQKAIHGATHGKPLASFPRVGEWSGQELIGWRYQPLLDAIPVPPEKAFRVVAGEFVTNEEGTGLVHLAPAFGADDYATVQKEGLAFFNFVDAAGRFAGTRWEAINGKTVFEANPVIADRLQREGKTLGRYEPEGHEHTYPFCWRCDSPLIYYAKLSWFVKTTEFKDRMVEFNRGIHWYPPEVGTGRMGEWLENNVDWALSRDRYWGTPLPVWECGAHPSHRLVIGSFAELRQHLRRGGSELPADFDPHKPFIDEVTFACVERECGGRMRRVPEVIDAWFDSGAMQSAQWHYPFEHEAEFSSHFPADFICEGLDQTRGWFYSLLAIGAGVFDRAPYRNVIVNGLVLDAQGRKMSKRLGNLVDPWQMIERFGADAVRVYLLAASQVGLPKRFDAEQIPDVALGFLTRLRHTYGFFALYAEDWTAEPWRVSEPRERLLEDLPPVDRWLLSRLDATVAAVREAWSAYDVTAGVRSLMAFCDDDLSNWYVRVNRARFWAPDASADPAALATLYEALVAVSRLLAPAAPFLSDALHHRLAGTSVHLAGFPEDHGRRDPGLDAAMDAVRRLASLARSVREDARIRVRQPLGRMKVALPATVKSTTFAELIDVLSAEVNVKRIEVAHSEMDLVRPRAKPNFRALGAVHGKQTPVVAASITAMSPDQVIKLERGHTVRVRAATGEEFDVEPAHAGVEREPAGSLAGWKTRSEGPYVVALDPTLTPELEREGITREVINRVQRLRKEAGYDYRDRIAVSVTGAPEVVASVAAAQPFIFREVLARRLETGEDLPHPDVREAVDIDGRPVVVSLARMVDDPVTASPAVPDSPVAKRTLQKPAGQRGGKKKPAGRKPRRKGK